MPRTYRFTAPCGSQGGSQNDPQGSLEYLVEKSLQAQGFESKGLPFYKGARELLAGLLPLGSSLAARFGYIYIQDASSMLPALALAKIIAGDGSKGSILALDMCASPGGKSSLLASLLGQRALVLANEPSPKRLATLRRNLELMNQLNTGSISHQGQHLPLPSAGACGKAAFAGFDYILLDPPCSGWGTVEKNPQVLELWQGERLGPLVGLQRLLLREAVRLLRPGGALVYSTCTTNVQENEEQVAWALNDLDAELGAALSLEPLLPFSGFVFDDPLAPLAGQPVLRVPQNIGLGQGFFLAGLRKGAAAKAVQAAPVFAKTAKKREKSSATPTVYNIARESLDSPLCDSSLLPLGEIREQAGVLYFYHAAALEALPPNFYWRGFPLGKNMRINTALRALMPSLQEARERGAAVLDADLPQALALISGQSLKLDAPQGEAGLYLNGLPLCRLKARGGRVFI